MNTLKRQILMKVVELFDLIIVAMAFGLAALASFSQIANVSLEEFFAMRISVPNLAVFICFLLGGHISFSIFGLYRSKRLSSVASEALSILEATSLGSFVLLLVSTRFHFQLLTLVFVVTFWLSCTVLMIVSRLVLRKMLKVLRLRGRNLRSVLIVGTNARAIAFARKIESQPELGYRLMGFVDESWQDMEPFKSTGYQLVSNFADFASYIRTHILDEVVVALPVQSFYQQSSQLIAMCEEQGIMVRYLTTLFNPKLAHQTTESLEDDSLLTFHSVVVTGSHMIAKRVLDLVLSSFVIVLLSPLLLLVALAIKLTSFGPVFFVQDRVGLNKRRFPLYKFRTMIADAEQRIEVLEALNEMDGPVFKIRNDPRITPIGKFLRRTSIDELPQLFNVLKGDMSLVGPRPLPVRDYNGFDQDWQRRRFSVRPGITCLWQINGRNGVTFEHWMELDMQYIDRWSFWLDLKILAKTIPAVVRGAGAA